MWCIEVERSGTMLNIICTAGVFDLHFEGSPDKHMHVCMVYLRPNTVSIYVRMGAIVTRFIWVVSQTTYRDLSLFWLMILNYKMLAFHFLHVGICVVSTVVRYIHIIAGFMLDRNVWIPTRLSSQSWGEKPQLFLKNVCTLLDSPFVSG